MQGIRQKNTSAESSLRRELHALGLRYRIQVTVLHTPRRVADIAFGEPASAAAWKTLPSWAAIGTADLAIGTDNVRSMMTRAGAISVDVEGSHVIMISQPQAVADLILTAVNTIG